MSLVGDFSLLSHFFYKKLEFSYSSQDFLFEIGIWFWTVDNLVSSHDASLVRASNGSTGWCC